MVALVHTLQQHTDDLLATCSADKTLSVYDTADFSELPGSPVSGHGYGVTDLRKPVAATPPQEIMCLCVCVAAALPGSSRHYAAGANSQSIYHERGKEAERFSQRFYLRCVPGEPPLSLVILARCLAGNQPSGPLHGSCVEFRLASCGQDSQLKIWIVSQHEGAAWVMKRLHTVTSHSAPVLSCALSLSDGDLVVSGSVDKSVAVHDTNAGAPLHTLKQHDRYVAAVALSPTMPVDCNRLHGQNGERRLNRGRQSAEPRRLGDSTHSPAELVVLCSLSCRSSEWMCCVCRFNNSLQTDLNDGWCISHERLSANVHHSYTERSRRFSGPEGSGRKLPGHFRPLLPDWSEGDVQTWLHEEELEPLVGNFKANIDGPELSRLNKETASELGMLGLKFAAEDKFKGGRSGQRQSVGLRLLRKIEALKAEQSGSDAPDEFLCPITRELTRDLVISADGYSYESWIRGKNKTSLMTNLPLQTTLLTPNRSLKMAITRWKSSQ
ncbi:unnamed protein product [Pleuronectes platessa]|uniref:U-box domain-containing protein n=1 Tax=Pleuronectes platessa TaxID=8262 RepID=A0A9N7Y704_PLEPL|nr:unnamed protein product [Pleuronectes platessa]